ncbi:MULTISPECIES: energy coupling factor transporter S component ThiW [Pontibacillus]|uniref:Energy coupling factor transporter S component ThiW n=1 Tax=Pontibacillus chungwhensis TaxID=265426 RepID=A0ABY8V3I3_9BACI|nr:MULTISPECIES: energy coupling factor transporter S component ThiW [Pontibacillus]MCD5322279.1 energy coupling factor transporter S component ThiW [Pontibacillus sp. HN14]WIF99571.1 energy coupling factor transporter S component ThiW [Pontibacillus chungwhensis]
MNKTRMITTMAIFVAIGTLGAQMLWFPAGVAKAYPVQHVVNVLAAVTLGPIPAVAIAFMIGVLRVLLGLGTLLAFPGGMIGAFLAGILYKVSKKKGLAVLGEVVGSGVIGALFAVLYAKVVMGTSVGALAFLPPFFVSSLSGAFLGWFVLSRVGERLSIRRA